MSPSTDPGAATRGATDATPERQFESYPNREVNLGALAIARALPIRDRRLVGPW